VHLQVQTARQVQDISARVQKRLKIAGVYAILGTRYMALGEVACSMLCRIECLRSGPDQDDYYHPAASDSHAHLGQ